MLRTQNKRFINCLVSFACFLLLSSSLVLAQTSRGTVSGTVKDPNGAVVPGAQITLISLSTSVERTATTNDDGFYRFDAVDLGNYSVKVNASGFGNLTKTNVLVAANQTSAVDAELTVGSGETTVDVVGAGGAELQTEAPVRGGNISTRQITELPFNDNPVALALTLPGVSTNRTTLGIGTFSVNGARGRSNNFLIDGTENNDISVAGQGFQITNEDAVQEVSIQTSNYDSEFGRSGGAVVNVITKGGTKNFHGTLAFEYDSSADDAITSLTSRTPGIVIPDANGNIRGRNPSSTQYVPAFTFGGPLFYPNFGEGGPVFNTRRDKNFFFVAYQETRFRQPGAFVRLIVPTASGRAALQQFASNPNVAAYLAATAATIAPIADQSPVSLDTTIGTPLGRPSVQIGTFIRNYSTIFTGKQFQLRTDHNISEKDQLSFRYISDRQLQPKGGEAIFEGFDSDFNSKFYNFLASETHVFNSTTTNELRLAYNRINYGFPLGDPSGPQSTLPNIALGGGLTALGSTANFPQGRIANNYQVQDTVTHIFGNHTIRGGVDYLRQISTQTAPANVRGSLSYAAGGGFTSLGNFVDNFGGANGTASRFFGSATYNPALDRIAGFLQDRWKTTGNLTLTLGLRYEYFGTPFNTLRSPAFTGLFNVSGTGAGPFNNPNKVKRDTNNFAPTFGIAYSPSYSEGIRGFVFGEKKSVFRAGYQIGYDSFFNNIASNAATSSPNGIITTNTSIVSAANPRGLANFSNQFPVTAATVLPSSAQTLIDPNLVNPYYQRYSVGMQRELPFNLVMDVSYVGSKGTKLFLTEDFNPTVSDPALRITPAGNTLLTTNRYDNVQGARTIRDNSGASSYNSGQLSVTRRFANNFLITGAYTFSKYLSNGDEVFATGVSGVSSAQSSAVPFIFGGLGNERAVSIFDRPHRASFTYVLQSPFFKEQNGFVGKALGGFQISGVTVFESGAPFTVFNGFDSDGVGGGLDRPNYNPNGIKGVRAVPRVDPVTNAIIGYYNPELVVGAVTSISPAAQIDPNTAEFIVNPAFVAGASGSVARVGTLGRNTERSRGVNNTDLTLSKRTRISERLTVQARADFFNAFNHPQFGGGPSVASTISNGFFLNPDNTNTSGGGRVIRYQLKLIF